MIKQFNGILNSFLLLSLSLFFFSLNLSNSALAFTAGKEYSITILHTNDMHGEYWKNTEGKYGLAAQKTLIDSIRSEIKAKDGALLVLSAGDFNTGNPTSDLLKGAPMITAMNSIAYDAVTVGNHEFDLKFKDLKAQEKSANFPYLGANVVYKKGAKVVFKESIQKVFGDLKIGIFGVTTEETQDMKNTEMLNFIPALDVAKKLYPKLRKENDVVIALTHIGHYENGNHLPRTPGDENLARAVPGIDVIIGGHTHTQLEKPIFENGTIITQAKERGMLLGRLDLIFKDGKLSMKSFQYIPVENVKEDETLLKTLEVYKKQSELLLQKSIGTIDHDFYGRGMNLKKETNLGRLIGRAQRVTGKADVGIMSDRGIRDNIKAGTVTYESVLRVLPFANTICTFGLTGPELKNYIESLPDILHMDGIVVTVKERKIVKMMIAGKDVILDEKNPEAKKKIYKIAVNSHNAEGGSLWPDERKNATYEDTGILVSHALKDYIEKNKLIKETDFQTVSQLQIEE